MKFEIDGYTFEFEADAEYPAGRRVETSQARDRLASGKIRIENYNFYYKTRRLNFLTMSQNDYNSLIDFFINKTDNGTKEFSFTDEYESVGIVVFVDPYIDFNETDFDIFEGSFSLEYIQ